MKDDTISRQAAIDALRKMQTYKLFSGDDMLLIDQAGAQTELMMLPSAQPEQHLDEWCVDCKEYDKEKHSCPRWNRVIRQTLLDAQPERKTGRWIPVSERLPDDLAEVNVTWVNHKPEPYYDFVKDKPFTASAVYYKGDWYWYSSACVDILAEYGENEIDKLDDAIEITAWKPLPEPYQERGEQE